MPPIDQQKIAQRLMGLKHWLRPAPVTAVPAQQRPASLPSKNNPPALNEESPVHATYGCSPGCRFLLIGLFGLDQAAVSLRADRVDEEMRLRGVIPVYLVDQADAVLPLRRKQRLFEVLPTVWDGHQMAPDLDWPFYLRRRAFMLGQKWQALGFISFGETPPWFPSTLTDGADKEACLP